MNILRMDLSASIFILAVILIRALTLYSLPKKTFLVLWSAVLCRLLIPFTISSQFSIFNLATTIVKLIEHQDGKAIPRAEMLPLFLTNTGASGTVVTADEISQMVPTIMTVIWLTGMIACALYFILTHIYYRQKYAMALPIESHFINEWKREHPIKRDVQIKQTDRISAPLTYGILHPVVLLPKTINCLNESELQYILAHEYTHIKRFDIIAKWLTAAVLCIHWFNPLVWLVYILANRDIELSCDETVIHSFNEKPKSSYANTLISLEERKSIQNPLCINFCKNVIEERIIAIMKLKKITGLSILTSILLIIFTSAIFATSPMSESEYSRISPVAYEIITDENNYFPVPNLNGRTHGEARSILDQLHLSYFIEEINTSTAIFSAPALDFYDKTLKEARTILNQMELSSVKEK